MKSLKTDLKILRLEYKKIIFFSLQMIILCLGIGVLGSQVLGSDKDVQSFKIAIVDKEQSSWTNMLLSTVNGMETVSTLCEIEIMPEDEAVKKLEQKEIIAAIVIPQKFIQGIMNGSNYPLMILKAESTIIESMVMDELVNAAVELLSASQVGIYTTLDAYEEFGMDDGARYDTLLTDINVKFGMEMLARNNMYEIKEVSATGTMEPIVHYILSAFISMMLFSLIMVRGVIKPFNNKETIMRYKVARLDPIKLMLSKMFAITIANILIGSLILGSVIICTTIAKIDIGWNLSISSMMSILLISLSFSVICIFLGMILKEDKSHTLFLFLIVAIMMFMSGGIIPESYMPESFGSIKWFSYNTYILELLKSIAGVTVETLAYVQVICITIVVFVINIVVLRRRGVSR